MKLAAPYPINEKRQSLIDEYNIEFNRDKHKIEDLLSWLSKDNIQEKRVNLSVRSQYPETFLPFDAINAINEIHKHVHFVLNTSQGKFVEELIKKKVKFYFSYDYNINSFCRLYDALEKGVTDVYIMEDLCYKMRHVKDLCDLYNVQIRNLVNAIPSFTSIRGTDPTSIVYTPENYEAMSLYFDVIEFELFNSWNRFDTLYKIWFDRKEWKEDLKFINFELDIHIPGESFPREVNAYKMNCGHRCVELQSACRKCEQYIKLAQDMHDNDAKIEYTKEKNWVIDDKEEVIKDIFN